jgi:hypothetical protein
MESNAHADATSTRRLLLLGVLAGPMYLAVGLAQAFLRQGFDFSRHPLSVLANGPGGWVQVANFLLTGAMVIAAAIGVRRAVGPTSRAAAFFLGAFGVSMIVAAVFRADPMDGFPVGTPKGPPTSMSTSGFVHFAAGGLGFVCLGVSCLVAAWVLSRRKMSSLARLSLFSGLVVLLGFFGGVAIPHSSPVLGIWIAVVAGWAWLGFLSRQLRLTTG